MSRPSEISGENFRPRPLHRNKIAATRVLGEILKRAFDILVSFVVLLLLLPIFALVAIFIKKDSPGPIFFKCPRMGKNEKPFLMHKFRTMFEEQKSYDGPKVTCKGDDRITPFGRWLRETKINELPQFWNVLVGEMSIVGPRPEDVEIALQWPEDVRKEVLSIRPGITSPASIIYHDEEHLLSKSNLMDVYLNTILPDKLRLDQLYVRNQSFVADLDIIFWTIVIFFPRISKSNIPEAHLFAGPLHIIFNRYISWFLIDMFVSFVSIGLVFLIWRLNEPLNLGVLHVLVLAVTMSFVFSLINTIAGINKILWTNATILDGLSLVLSGAAVMVGLLLFNFLFSSFQWFPYTEIPSSLVIIASVLAITGFVIVRYRLRLFTAIAQQWTRLRRHSIGLGEKVLIVGSGENFSIANILLTRNEFKYLFTIAGVVDDNIPTKYGMQLEGCTVLGRIADIPQLVEKENISVIVLTHSNIPSKIKEYIANKKRNAVIRVIFLENVLNIINQQLDTPLFPEFPLWSDDYLRYLAMHDSNTGLPNQILFQDHLHHAMAAAKRHHTQPMVMFIEVQLNSPETAPSTRIWNLIIKSIAGKLKKLGRESDILAFLGIYGFAYIFDDIPNENSIAKISKRIGTALSQPIPVQDKSYDLKHTIYVSRVQKNPFMVEPGKLEGLLDHLIANRQLVFEHSEEVMTLE